MMSDIANGLKAKTFSRRDAEALRKSKRITLKVFLCVPAPLREK
jgi:uncharacterized ferredoxin-like protein